MRFDSLRTSSIDLTTLTPPALPRPPAWICAFTTQTGPPSFCAPLTASSTLMAGSPRESGTLGAAEVDLDDALDALGADHHRHADIEIADAVFAVEPGGAGQHALLV